MVPPNKKCGGREGGYNVDGQTRQGLELDNDDDDGDVALGKPESASKLRLVQSADVDILGQGGILSFLAHMHRQTDHRSQATTDRCFE